MNRLILDIQQAKELRDTGMRRAETHADAVSLNWSDRAYAFLVEYIKSHPVFQAEDVRYAAQGIVPTPPSARAWGSVVVRAAKAGLIRQDGFKKVKNVKAHSTPAAVWKRVRQ